MPGYALPDGVTLKNLVGATNREALEAIESDYVSARALALELGAGPIGQFDAAHLKAIHRHLFQDLFEWAGRTRDERVRLSDGTIATEPSLRKPGGKPFLRGPAIPAALDALAAKLSDAGHLRGLSRARFAVGAADIMASLNAVHPFREGNGRTQRAFVQAIATAAGHRLHFSPVSRESMIRASIAAHEHGDRSMMRRMFDEISDPARVEILRRGLAALDKAGFAWNDRYVAAIQPGHAVDLVLAGIAGNQFMARTRNEILFGNTTELPTPWPQPGETFRLPAAPALDEQDDVN